jgi:hypothetical protein
MVQISGRRAYSATQRWAGFRSSHIVLRPV